MAQLRHRISNEAYTALREQERPCAHEAAARKEALIEAVLDAYDKGNRFPVPVVAALKAFRAARARSIEVRYAIREQDELRREEAHA